ncbi:hypothetical protein BDV96DRAFT_655740 [Lophiotrema nucula]|uniref:Geranylgeranyl transferase type-2 subunit alpha n=1 Tax=Lophiotrema nucula TaxID=690887 RepID=A0A6A5YDZ1_9PLEO|nr:hypothetical protein BDV96DRAFT_655740 [Lophiotrema nucula]
MASHGISRTSGTLVRSEEQRQNELQQIATYKDLVDLVNTKVAERQYTVEVLGLVTKLLNENPEYYTIWNHRRRVLIALLPATPPDSDDASSPERPHEFIDGDLQLTFALLRKFPKCYWIWNHRNWILRKGESMSDTKLASRLWSGELQLVGKLLHADSRNFHAWSYRRDVVAQLQRLQAKAADSAAVRGLVESEFEYTTKMIKANLSNFSAWHNRSKLIPRLLNERQANGTTRRKMLEDELQLICTAINTDPFDQSIWFYHQSLMSTISSDCPRESMIVQDLSNGERLRHYAREMEYIKEILEDEADCKWIYESLLSTASFYVQVEAGTKAFTTLEMQSWLDQLRRLDPLRRGRWDELGRRLNL